MTDAEIRDAIMTSLWSVAPEVPPEEIDPSKPIGPPMEVDSIGFLSVLMGIDGSPIATRARSCRG